MYVLLHTVADSLGWQSTRPLAFISHDLGGTIVKQVRGSCVPPHLFVTDGVDDTET